MKKLIHVPLNDAKQFGHMDTPNVKKDTKPFLIRNGVPLFWDKPYDLRPLK